MKKIIQKPVNWQDFEDLSKKLWGEVWGIPMKIKKNGRNGQPQAGVDVYGIPMGEERYWGIQCKGKDDYSNTKLTKTEIDEEITKAKTFKPELAMFIFATTMNKDSEIEEYVRIKDLKSRKNSGFEILLFCWEDIADLIDENQDTYNFWVANKQHKTKFDFKVQFNDLQTEYIIHPKFVRRIRRYKLKEPEESLNLGMASILSNTTLAKKIYQTQHATNLISTPKGRINEAICGFEIIMSNTGSIVIEDWRVKLEFLGEYKEILDQLGTGPMGMIDITALKYKRTYVNGNKVTYSPKNNKPLIQKDNRYFEVYIIPLCKEYKIPIKWELLARDYDASGELYLIVEPEIEDQIVYVEVDSEEELKEEELISIEEKKNYIDKEKK